MRNVISEQVRFGIDFAQFSRAEVQANGGASAMFGTGSAPSSGYMVSLPGREERIPVGLYTAQHAVDYAARNYIKGAYLGAWLNPDDGHVYLDVSNCIGSRAEAEMFGRLRSQLAIYDVAKGEAITL